MMIYTWPCVRASNEGLRSVYLPCLGTRLAKCLNSVLNVKALVVSRRFQPGEGPSGGLLHNCEIFANLHLKLYWPSVVCPQL